VGGSGLGLFKVISWHFPGGTEETHENLQTSLSPGRDSSPEAPE